jgi:hypothetical protein
MLARELQTVDYGMEAGKPATIQVAKQLWGIFNAIARMKSSRTFGWS